MSIRAALFDVDGTLATGRVWRGLMDYFADRRQRRLTHYVFLALHYPRSTDSARPD